MGAAPSRRWLENGHCACFEAASRRGRRSHRGASHTLTPVRLLGLWEPRPRGDGFKMTTVLVSRLHRAEGGAPTERRSHTLTPVRLLGLWEPRPRGDGLENGHCACFEAVSRRGRRSHTLRPVRRAGLWEPRPRGDGLENGRCACFEAVARPQGLTIKINLDDGDRYERTH